MSETAAPIVIRRGDFLISEIVKGDQAAIRVESVEGGWVYLSPRTRSQLPATELYDAEYLKVLIRLAGATAAKKLEVER